jgi:hypothetical protein
MAYSKAIGCGCLLGAGVSQLSAAEWSLQPSVSWSTDFDSDRNLAIDGKGSESAVLYGDLQLKRALENTEILLEPKFAVRRYSDTVFGAGNDRSLFASFSHIGERTHLDLTASVADQSTLTTELLGTGILQGNSHQRFKRAGGDWSWARTERGSYFLQLAYSDVSYSGANSVVLPGYRYPSVSLGQRFNVSERSMFSVSAFGDALLSDRAGASSREAGAQVEFSYARSERTSLDVSIGESQRTLAGVRGHGTVGALSITHKMSLGTLAAGYSRSLVPYGTGFLVERQQITASATRSLSTFVDADISVFHIQNNQSAVALGLDRLRYDTAGVGLNWRIGETWTIRPQLSTNRSQPLRSTATVHQWAAALIVTWKPPATAFSR